MVELTVDGMTCSGCVKSVTRAVQALDPEAQVQVDLPGRQVRIDTTATRADIVTAIGDAGYDVVDTPAGPGGH